ncbi:Major facilitator superfamily domain, general substrate transporter [Pseudocohnilembus persalinus]|uniref:Major facilitator superfamily domain, general substrate transporter n=1 Tax=Pseudocohnilembus persalinus TaxID=266149 RepID=A0A0V0R3C9_PSEPJ|nr:Major facilitator superfamily domain, general substrate transporter [Pseudocohnilembus persalinus]|eukprot:KRX08858.1 Major facilitator superfamily domain, general substrate transporter [Pseudocohnilembus persalinus]
MKNQLKEPLKGVSPKKGSLSGFKSSQEQEQNIQKAQKKQLQFEEDQKKLGLIYAVILCTNVLVNFDHGIIPAATKQIKEDLNIDDVELGLLGSVVYAGLLGGSVAATYVFQNFKTKQIIVSTVVAYALSLALFLVTSNIFLLGVSRTLVGFFQVFLVVFFPVWVDLHGGKRSTMWLTFLQLGVPLGVVIGYCVTGIYITQFDKWQYSFMTQIFCLIPCGAAMYLFPDRLINVQGDQVSRMSESRQSEPELQFMGRTSVSPQILQKSKTYKENLKNLFSNRLFLFTMLSLAALYFVVTGIQFWISDYFQLVLHQPKAKVVKYFSLVSVSAPTLGVIFGGYVIEKYGGPPNGGYTGAYALDICCLNGFLSAIAGIPIPFLDNFEPVIILLWLQLFFGGALMPAVMGIMINSIPPELRAFGNSTAQVFQNLLGYLPAPLAYGIVQEHFHPYSDRAGMILLCLWGFWGVFFLFLGKNFKENIVKQIEYQMQNIEEIELTNFDNKNKQPIQFMKYDQEGDENVLHEHLLNLQQKDDLSEKQREKLKQKLYENEEEDENKQLIKIEQQQQLPRQYNSTSALPKNSSQPHLQSKLNYNSSQKQVNKRFGRSGTQEFKDDNDLGFKYRQTILKIQNQRNSSLDPEYFMPLSLNKKMSQIINLQSPNNNNNYLSKKSGQFQIFNQDDGQNYGSQIYSPPQEEGDEESGENHNYDENYQKNQEKDKGFLDGNKKFKNSQEIMEEEQQQLCQQLNQYQQQSQNLNQSPSFQSTNKKNINTYISSQNFHSQYKEQYGNNSQQQFSPKFQMKKKIPQRISMISVSNLLGKTNAMYIDSNELQNKNNQNL